MVLGPFIVRHPDHIKGSIEQFMVQYVLPEFTSQERHLRSMVFGVVTKASITRITEENLNNHSCAVTLALDIANSVCVQAALAITELFVVHDSGTLSLRKLARSCKNELLPVASQLTARLCESYLRLAREGLAQQKEAAPDSIDVESLVTDGDDDKVYGTMGVAKTIETEVIIPIIRFTLENKLIDLFDNMYDLVDALTFCLHAISPNMWPVFELTYDLFKSDALISLMVRLTTSCSYLDRIAHGGDNVQKSSPRWTTLYHMYRTAMTSPQLGDNDKINGCKLAESMLLNLHGHVDDILVNAVLYNASAALHFMEDYKAGFSRTFFERCDNKLPRVHDKKLSILALCKLLEMEAGAIPEGFRDGWPGIVGGALNIFKALPQAIAKRKVLEDQLVEGSDDEDEDETRYLDLEGDEDEDVWDEDFAYLEILTKEGARLKEKSEKTESGDDESDISEESEIEEELEFSVRLTTPTYMVPSSKHYRNQNSALYQAATMMLTVERQTVLMEVVTIANQADRG
ncbi:hypothetical protein BD769DRAFT_1668960 [Suillus cothurnatus]|nr:hypothetical protein BD769DRAFT_1668960 [Suillus cothurnatus]